MQELTLTGGTLLPTHHTTNRASNSGSTSSDPVLTTTEGSHSHAHHEHGHQHHHGHGHSSGGGAACCGAPKTIKPVLKLKKPAAELAQEYDDAQMYETVQMVVRMGGYDLLVELVTAWKNERSASGGGVIAAEAAVDRKLQEYDSVGHTLTHWASKRVDDVRFVQYFVNVIPFASSGASTNGDGEENGDPKKYPTPVHRPTKDETAMTALHWACTLDHALPVVKALLDASASAPHGGQVVEIRDATGCTPLLIAAQHGHVETCAYLIQRAGADLQAQDNSKDSATHWAAYKGSEQVLGLLSFYDTRQLMTADAYGQTPLHLAALRGHVSVCRYIIQQLLTPKGGGGGGDGNNTRSARLQATRDVKELLYLKDQNGRTPYELAVHKEKGAVAAALQLAADNLTARKNWQSQLKRALTVQSLRKLCTVRTIKVWMGLPEVDDVDESPRFPYYFVVAQIVLHVVFYLTVFVPITKSGSGVLWDCLGMHVVDFMLIAATAYCLRQCSTTNPGRLDNSYPGIEIWRRLYEQTLDAFADDEMAEKVVHVQLCHTCHIARPARSKHDRFGRACVLQFDHHCPFVGAAVGLYNYKLFYGFLVFMTVYLVNFWILLFLYYHRVSSVSTFTMVLGVVMGLHICFPAGMLIMHTQLICVNLTTNEHLNRSRYDYLWTESSNSGAGHRRFYNPWDKGFVGNMMDRLQPGDHCYLLPEQERSAEQLLVRDVHGQLGPNLSDTV